MADINWRVLKTVERVRIYYFPRHTLRIQNVAKIEVIHSGKHRIETVEGKKYFVGTGWDYMEIDTDEWTC